MMAAQSGDLLKIETAVLPRRLSRGEEGKVVLRVGVQKGVIISSKPTFIIEIVPNPDLIFPKNFFTASDLALEVVEGEGGSFLNLVKPIEIPFTVGLEAKKGGHILEGRIKYFARSPAEGWCLKSSVKFSVPFSTRQSVAKKKS